MASLRKVLTRRKRRLHQGRDSPGALGADFAPWDGSSERSERSLDVAKHDV